MDDATLGPNPEAIRLQTLERLDFLFDRERSGSLETVVPAVFGALHEVLPGHHWFLATMLPVLEDQSEQTLLEYRRQVFCSSSEAASAAARVLEVGAFELPAQQIVAAAERSAPSPGLSRQPREVAGALCVPLYQGGDFLGILGLTAGDAPQARAVAQAAALRIDTEVDLQVQRLRRRVLAARLNRALEDYYLERGVERAMGILLANRICTGAYLIYDRSGDDQHPDLVSMRFACDKTEELHLPENEVREFLADHAAVPGVIGEQLAAAGQGLTLPLEKRTEDGRMREFGVMVFLGPSFSYSLRLTLAELMGDLDSAMINYHEKRRELSRFLSPAVVRRLLEGDRTEIEREMAPRQQAIALGFIDVVGYSGICTRHARMPQQIARLLQDWKRRVREVTFRNGGIVDKFIGDCLFFHRGPWSSDPPRELALDAIRIAVGCAQETEALSQRLADYGFGTQESLRVSTGLHFGPDLVVGDIGGEFTAIGADVNIAQRIQGHQTSSGRLVVSAALRSHVGDSLAKAAPAGLRLEFGPMRTLTLKGVGPFEVCEVLMTRAA